MKRFLAAVIIGILATGAQPLAQKDKPKAEKGPEPTRKGYSLFTDPGKRYAVEFPYDWRWMIIAGWGEALTAFVQPKDEAAVIVERFRMRIALAPDEIDESFGRIETDLLKENQPMARDVTFKVTTAFGKRVVRIDYRRPGVGEAGKVEDQQVLQYSIPVNSNLYRITCAALASKRAKYEPNFDAVMESFKPGEEIAAAKP